MALRVVALLAILAGGLLSGCSQAGHTREGIWEALEEGDAQRIELILSRNHEAVNEQRDGKTPLQWAVSHTLTSEDVIKMLLANGADVGARDSNGCTPLHSAMLRTPGPWGGEGIPRLLLESGADPNAADRDGWTPLHLAAKLGRVGHAKALITGGANVHAKTLAAITYEFNRTGSYPAAAVITIPAGATPLAVASEVEWQTPWADLQVTQKGIGVIKIPDSEHEGVLGVISYLELMEKPSPPKPSGKPSG